MTTYSSIRIYIPLGNSITPGFYNVVGYFGDGTITPSGGWYNINLDNGFYPLIISNSDYYYLSYDDGYSVNAISLEQYISGLDHPIVASNEVTIYQDKVGDFNTVGIGHPLNGNISIVGLSSLKVAYRTFTMDVYDNYAIQKFGTTIYDEYNIIDLSEEEIMLVETNPDHYVFDPTAGSNVELLYHFTVDCRKNIDTIHSTVDGNTICVYEKNTKSIVSRINAESIEYSGTTFSFYLATRLTTSGVHFLYIPSNTIEFVNGTKSPFTMIGYKINVSEDEDEIQFYEYQSIGKLFNKIRIRFPNIGSYTLGLDRTKIITISGPRCNKTVNSSRALTLIQSNIVELDTGVDLINFGATTETYNIDIPIETFQLSSTEYSNPIRLVFSLIPDSESLPEDHSLIVKFDPSDASDIFKLDKFSIKFCLDRYLENDVIVYPLSGKSVKVTDSSGLVTIESISSCTESIEYDKGYKMFVFTYTLQSPITNPGVYRVKVPAETFKIGTGNDVNSAVEAHYNLIKLSEEHGLNKYCYDMLEIVPTTQAILNEEGGAKLSFKKDDTIFVNTAHLDQVKISPAVSIIETDNNDVKKVTYYNPSLPENRNNVLEMTVTLAALLDSGEWKYDSATYKSGEYVGRLTYGMYYGERRSFKLYNLNIGQEETDGIFFKDDKLGEVPKKMDLGIYIKLNGHAVEYGVNIQFLEDAVYNKYYENNNWVEEATIDIYSGEECRRMYVTTNPTNMYDSLVREIVLNDLGEPVTRYLVDLKSVTKVRLGNLTGIYNETFGLKQPFGYGLYGQNVFLTGNFFLNNGRSLVDIDNDITLAVGDITSVQKNLKSLDDRIYENSKTLDEKISNAEKGVSSTISNYISTNRDAIFKLGLDYSIWSLGSAGISLYNPNVKYTTDEYGERVVDPKTVGDFDEGILMQADRLRINNYSSVTVKENGVERVYYKLLVTSDNPKDWYYPNQNSTGLFYPMCKHIGSGEAREVPFYYFYIRQEDFLNSNIYLDSTLGCDEVLRYVYISDDDLGNPFIPQTIQGVNYAAYAFNSFYSAPVNSVTFYKYKSTGFVSAGVHDQVWFLPAVVQAAMFHNGKIYAKYIDTEGLSVEHVIAIPRDLSKYDPYGSRNIRRNENFDISKPISDSNYPVLMDVGTFTPLDGESYITSGPCKTVPFVIISGYNGKITARSADISGRLTIGDDDSDNSKYIIITDNVTEDTSVEYKKTPAMYIMLNQAGTTTQLAKFSGDNEGDLSKKYLTADSEEGTFNCTDTYSVSVTHEKTSIIQPTPGMSPDDIYGYPDKLEVVGYKVTSNLVNGVNHAIIDIPASEKTRNAKINLVSSRLTIDSNTIYSYGRSGYLSGNLNFLVTFYIREKNDSSYSRALKITSFVEKLDLSYKGLGQAVVRTGYVNAFNITLSPTDSGYEIYYTIQDLSDYVILLRTASSVNYPLTFNFTVPGLTCNVNVGKLDYMAQFTGNGLSLGFDKNNYFSSYYVNNETEGQPKMVTQFRSGGLGISFDVGNQYYLLPNNIRMPMLIPFIYFQFDAAGWNIMTVPTLNGDNRYSLDGIFLQDPNEDDSFRYFELISPLVNVFAIKGNCEYTYKSTYSDELHTPIERAGKKIHLNNDAVYEINFSKLFNAIKASSGANYSAFLVFPSITRYYHVFKSDFDTYFTEQGLTSWTPKLDEITNTTVYISTPLDNTNDLCRIIGTISMFTPYYTINNGGTTVTVYSQSDMENKVQYYSNILDGFTDRFYNLSSDDLRSLVASMLLNYKDKRDSLYSINLVATVDEITNSLDTLGTQIDAKLSELEGSGSGQGEDPVNPSGSEQILSSEPTETAVDSLMHAKYAPGADPLPNTSSTHEYLGYIETGVQSYGTPVSYGIYIIDVGNMVSNVSVEPSSTSGHSYDIYGDISANSVTSAKRIHLWIQFPDANQLGYINVCQAAGSGSGSGDNPQSTDTPLQAKLRLFKSDGGIDLDVDDTSSEIYQFILSTYNSALGYSSGLDLSTITDGPVVSTGSQFNSESRDGWLLGLILTMLYPFKKTNGITSITSASAAEACKNHQPLKTAFTRWGYGSNTSSISDISDYQQKYNGMMLAGIIFSKLFSNTGFVNNLKEIKQKNYTAGYIKSYIYNDATDFLSNALGLDGKQIFPLHPGTSTSPSSSNKLMIRDNQAYSDGKSIRTYGLSDGRTGYDDRCDSLNYLIDQYCAAVGTTVAGLIGSYTEKYGVGKLAEYGISSRYYLTGSNADMYRDDKHYLSNGSEYGSDTAWRTFIETSTKGGSKADIMNNKKFLYLYLCVKTGTRTGGHMKGKGSYARTRPFLVYNETRYDSDNNTGNDAAGYADFDTYALDMNTSGGRDPGTSYPSGHTGYSWGVALSWQALFGGNSTYTNNLFKRAYRYSEGRVIVGAHWQHCVEVGRLTASCGFAMLAANESFLNVLLEARS